MAEYFQGDIIMYNYVKELPYFGIVTISKKESRNCWVRWWGSQRGWDSTATSHDKYDTYTTLIGVLPPWAETDELFGSNLPLTKRDTSV